MHLGNGGGCFYSAHWLLLAGGKENSMIPAIPAIPATGIIVTVSDLAGHFVHRVCERC